MVPAKKAKLDSNELSEATQIKYTVECLNGNIADVLNKAVVSCVDNCMRKVSVQPDTAWTAVEESVRMKYEDALLQQMKYRDADGDDIFLYSSDELRSVLVNENVHKFHIYYSLPDVRVEYTVQNVYANAPDKEIGRRIAFFPHDSTGAAWKSIQTAIQNLYPKATVKYIKYGKEEGKEIFIQSTEELDTALFKWGYWTLSVFYERNLEITLSLPWYYKTDTINQYNETRKIYPLTNNYMDEFNAVAKERWRLAKISQIYYKDEDDKVLVVVNNEGLDRAIRKGIVSFTIQINIRVSYTYNHTKGKPDPDQPNPTYGRMELEVGPYCYVWDELINNIRDRGISYDPRYSAKVKYVEGDFGELKVVHSKYVMQELVFIKGVSSFHVIY